MSSLITAAKVSGALTAGAGIPTTIYFVHNHLTSLYEVEQEVIDKSLKLSLSGPESGGNSVTITAPSATTSSPATEADPKLKEGYSWSCVITVTSSTDGGSTNVETLKTKLTAKLPISSGTQNKENKELLVKACAKHRQSNPSYKLVTGSLKVTEKSGSSFDFDDLELNVLTNT